MVRLGVRLIVGDSDGEGVTVHVGGRVGTAETICSVAVAVGTDGA